MGQRSELYSKSFNIWNQSMILANPPMAEVTKTYFGACVIESHGISGVLVKGQLSEEQKDQVVAKLGFNL